MHYALDVFKCRRMNKRFSIKGESTDQEMESSTTSRYVQHLASLRSSSLKMPSFYLSKGSSSWERALKLRSLKSESHEHTKTKLLFPPFVE